METSSEHLYTELSDDNPIFISSFTLWMLEIVMVKTKNYFDSQPQTLCDSRPFAFGMK